MGNHHAGRAVSGAAEAWWDGRGASPPPGKEEALGVLDRICERWRGSDAEFDDEDAPDSALGRLIILAFGDPSLPASAWDDEDAWWDGPYGAFNKRFAFC